MPRLGEESRMSSISTECDTPLSLTQVSLGPVLHSTIGSAGAQTGQAEAGKTEGQADTKPSSTPRDVQVFMRAGTHKADEKFHQSQEHESLME